MILAAGALFILTLLILLFYQSSAEQTSISIETEAVLAGAGIAQSLIAEIQKRSFDEKTTTKTTYYPDSLTVPDSLGKDSGEFFFTQFDDVDDFDDYKVIDESTRLGKYKLHVKVGYIDKMIPDSTIDHRTFSKRINVTVSSVYLHQPLEFNHVIGY
jgi:hypothetical protein